MDRSTIINTTRSRPSYYLYLAPEARSTAFESSGNYIPNDFQSINRRSFTDYIINNTQDGRNPEYWDNLHNHLYKMDDNNKLQLKNEKAEFTAITIVNILDKQVVKKDITKIITAHNCNKVLFDEYSLEKLHITQKDAYNIKNVRDLYNLYQIYNIPVNILIILAIEENLLPQNLITEINDIINNIYAIHDIGTF